MDNGKWFSLKYLYSSFLTRQQKRVHLKPSQLCTDLRKEPLTMTTAKKSVARGTNDRWQSQWNKCNKAQALHEFHPHIPTSGYHSITNRNTEKRLFRLKRGFTHLDSELFKYGYMDTPTCPCGLEEETIPHVLLHCPQYMEARDEMQGFCPLIFL